MEKGYLMADLSTEKGVLEYLDLPDFRHMTKDKVMQFASVINEMNPEVAKEAIRQFPEFKSLLSQALTENRELAERSIESNDESMRECASASMRVFDGCDELLKNPDYTFEQKMQVIERMEMESEKMRAKDSENKKFILDSQKLLLAASGIVSVAAVVFLGGKFNLKLPSKG